jgi:hypothetical protein
MSDYYISTGFEQNPYKEFTYVIQPSGTQRIDYAYSFFRVMSLSANTIEAKFGASGTFTSIIGGGVGIDFGDRNLPFVELRNVGGVAVTITVAMMIGVINDDRLNVSGNVNVINGSTPFAVEETTNTILNRDDLVIAAGAGVSLIAARPRRTGICVQGHPTNVQELRIGHNTPTSTRGIIVEPNQTIFLPTAAQVYVRNPAPISQIALVTEFYNV